MSKIIFTDVDGTLYDYDGNLPESTIKAIRTLRNNGNKVYMVTGRSKAENKKEIWDIGFDGMIGGNGAYVEDHGEVLLHQTITLKQCQHFVSWFESRNIEYYEETNVGLFASKNFNEVATPACQKYMLGKGAKLEEVNHSQARDLFHGLIEGGELIREDINKVSFVLNRYQDYVDAIEEFPDLNVGNWGGKGEEALFGDLGVKGIDKGYAIDLLLKHLGARKEDAIGIGDAKQDIPMLNHCGLGITFASGGEEIKAMADYISEDVAKEGFAKAFAHFGLI